MEKPVFNNVHNKAYETKTGLKWDSRACAVVCHVCFIKDGQPFILLGKRGDVMDNAGKWNVPCGYLDWNENIHDAMFREVWEETGLDLSKYHGSTVYAKYYQPWMVYSEPDENKQNVAMHMGVVINMTSSKLPELSLDNMEANESTGAYWMHIDSALNIPEHEWAFSHYKRMRSFIEEISSVLQKYK